MTTVVSTNVTTAQQYQDAIEKANDLPTVAVIDEAVLKLSDLNVTSLVAAVLAGDILPGSIVTTTEYNENSGYGGNSYKIKDAVTSGNRPAEDGGEVIHVGSAGLYLEGIFYGGSHYITQYGAVSDYNTGTKTGTNNLPFLLNAWSGSRNVKVPSGGFWVDGDGSAAPLITWFNASSSASLTGEGESSKIWCSDNVINLMSATGLSISNIEFDGGFDPSAETMVLTPLLTLNQNTSTYKVKIRNTYGSNIFTKFGPHRTHFCNLGNYGDHAFYMSSGVGEITQNIEFSNNVIDTDPEYSNDVAYGLREAVKVKNTCKDVRIVGNEIKGASLAIRVENDGAADKSYKIVIDGNTIYTKSNSFVTGEKGIILNNDAEVTVNNNIIMGTNPASGSPAGIIFADENKDVVITNNTIRGYNIAIQNTSTELGGQDAFIAFNHLFGAATTADEQPYVVTPGTDSTFGIYHIGQGARVFNNDTTGFTSAGIRSKYGNTITSNKVYGALASSKGIAVLVEDDVAQPRTTVDKNELFECNRGIDLGAITVPITLTNNEFTGSVGASLFTVSGGDVALHNSEYFGNTVISGVVLPNDFSQGVKLTRAAGLPTATVDQVGRQRIQTVANVDTVYICLQTGASTYAWQAMS